MRISIDASPLNVRDGGIRRYTASLIAGLARIDADNEYALFGSRLPTSRPPTGPNFRWDDSHFPGKHWLDRLRLVGEPGRADLVHGTNYAVPLFASAARVLTVHDLSVHLFPRSHPRLRRLQHRMLPSLCRRADRIIADSANTRRDLSRYHGISPRKIDVVHLAAGAEFVPVRDPALHHAARQRYGLPDAFVLYLGAVESRKNLETLIRSAAILARQGVPQKLVIAGAGEAGYVERLLLTARHEGLEPGSDVVFTGHVEDRDLPTLYSQCDLFVYPSLYEGFGLPPLEAMACGAPVIVPANSSFFEIYDGYDMLVDVERADALADAMVRVLSERSLRDRLVDEGSKRARSRSWDGVAAETLEVYRTARSGA